MKKLLLIAVSLSIFLGTVSFVQGQDTDTDKKMQKKKKKKKSTDSTSQVH